MSGGSSTLFLIDGYALIYRAFFAMISRPLRTSKGENTSAAWGVANFLNRLIDEQAPGYVAWVHDAGSSFRADIFPEYKATRQKLDEELQQDFDRSVERIEELLAAFGIPLVAVEGYEADDVIGTLAERAAAGGMSVVIVSGDKDFHQLVGPCVSLLNPGRGGPAGVDAQWVTEANADARLGVRPERVIDYLALVGDSSDNVPGVRGIGDKTARQLIEAYGDLDAILAHATDVKAKRAREALLAHAEDAQLSRELVTIKRDVPLDVDPASLARGAVDEPRLRRLYTDLEFHALLRSQDTPPAVEDVAEVRVVRDTAGVRSAVAAARRAAMVAFDTETTNIDPMQAELVGFSLAIPGGDAWYFPLAHRPPDGELVDTKPVVNLPGLDAPDMRAVKELLEDESVPKAGHNVKYDWLVLRRAGGRPLGSADDDVRGSGR